MEGNNVAGFNPKDKLIKLQGKDYLEVRWRVFWFREQHPGGAITTELIATEPNVIVRAQITNADGVLLAADYGTAPAAGKGTWTGRSVEKASTAAVGRALALAGYGTQFDADDEGEHLADSPVEPPVPAPVNGWTRDQASSLVTEARNNGVDDAELLRLLSVERVSEYTPGFTAARAELKKYLKARPAPPADGTEPEQVHF